MAEPLASGSPTQEVRFDDVPEIIVSPTDTPQRSPQRTWFTRNMDTVRVRMPLRTRITRVVTAVLLVVGAVHFGLRYLPDSLYTFGMMQTSVAMLSLVSLALLILTHHKRNGQLLTREQEEWILIGAFGLFWLATLVAWRAWNQPPAEFASTAPMDAISVADTRSAKAAVQPGAADRKRPWPCSSDAVYCVVEEWSYY
ncbi:hypothetical protein OBBRIDRAFT_789592 [Obba rivulosa]|uniref:Uncharacterized protein n=1 Tax=Obba rivulosa TaxID=1052685 RepID=A0A8E2J3M0_9APHY|nr:hypothetical protein OBBRIDRAFT_789592 [Obba rivulosa]